MHCPSWNHVQPPEASAKTIATRTLLAPLYAWFSEGFATRGLKGAKTPLDELGT